MLNRTLLKALFFLHISLVAVSSSQGQCTTANLNWDNLDYLVTTGNYAGFVTSSMALNQNFAFGANRLTVAVANTNVTLNGSNTTHTGETTSYGTGADVSFTTTTSSARTITLTFDVEVTVFKLSIYDLDNNQRVTVTAASGPPVTSRSVTLTKPSGGGVTIAGSPGNTPTGTGPGSNYANNVNTGTLNIDVLGPVKTITLSFSNASGDFWLSDMSSCVVATFPNSYYIVAKPFTGMASYVLTVVDNDIYYTNVANGVSTLLFTDPGHTNINSLGYDPYKGYVYYAYTLTSTPQNDKALKKYDVNTGIISTVLADVTTLGIPTFENGIEVGAGAFYGGSYYLGIEAYNSGVATGRKSSVWRIDFNGDVPYRASQVYASPTDAGTTIIHDWGDIGFSNGILYDFDAAAASAPANYDYYHYNMQTGAIVNYTPSGTGNPSQTAVAWNEQIYNVDGDIMTYSNGVVGTQFAITSTPAIPGGGRWGDAAEAFRPFVDFGDAPATYDPSASDPGVHLSSPTTLRIGTAINIEAAKRGTTSTEDNFDDGISTVSYLLPGTSNYLVSVSVYNNTGSNATLTAWLDYNGNGVFNSGEGITQTVATSGSVQSKYLYWPGITTPLSNGSYTYLRVRLTSTSNGMTTSNPTGYFNNGEVEDYRVPVDNYPLAATLLSFDVKKTNDNKAKLDWSANEDAQFIAYEVQKSKNGMDWSHLAFISSNHQNGINNYTFTDDQPYKGTTYYRLSLNSGNKYSAVKSITVEDLSALVNITPNPARDHTTINILNNGQLSTALIKVMGMGGNQLYAQHAIVRPGDNPINLPIRHNWTTGMYIVQVTMNGEITNKKLMLTR